MGDMLYRKELAIRQTKIVCTLGPASSSPEMIENLIRAGMDAARLNFSHGTYDDHLNLLSCVRKASAKLKKPVAIILDLCGPKIRLGDVQNGRITLYDGETIRFEKGNFIGSKSRLSVTYKYFVKDVAPGARILLADGAVELSAVEKDNSSVTCKVIAGGSVTPHAGVNLPGTKISSPTITSKDKKDIEWAVKNGVDYIALSFVRSAGDVRNARNILHRAGSDIGIIAKIEKPEALDDIENIVSLSDAVMVARGDLGVELPVEKVPFIQKRLIDLCHTCSKPVITATQMLQSMMESPRPTRAEVSDVANAIFDGTDAVMLSGETAVGRYPVGAAAYMDTIADETEDYIKSDVGVSPQAVDSRFHPIANALSRGAAEICQSLDIKAALVYSVSGATALFLSKRRLHLPIIGVSPSALTVNRMSIYRGVLPLLWKKSRKPGAKELFDFAERFALRRGICKKDDVVLFVTGTPLGKRGEANIIRIKKIETEVRKTKTPEVRIGRWSGRKLTFTIDYDRCIRCGVCVRGCPADIYKLVGADIVADRDLLDKCVQDFACVESCPVGAITIEKKAKVRRQKRRKKGRKQGKSALRSL